MIQLRVALEASWDDKTSYLGVFERHNRALGQCYSTARVVQFYFPQTEIVEGQVWNGQESEKHFWNLLQNNGNEYHIDFTWQQFPQGSVVKKWKLRDRETLGDGPETLRRIEILHQRVQTHLNDSHFST